MENKLISEIRSVLINDWDPVGIGNNPNLIDEYGGYIGLIINILMQKSDVKTIVALLKSIEITEMGNENVDIKCLYNVATKLKNIGDMYWKNEM